MSKLLNKKIAAFALAGAAVFSSCQKEKFADIKPVDKTPVVTTPVDNNPVATEDTLHWTVYNSYIDGDKSEIITNPTGEDNEYDSHRAPGTHPFYSISGKTNSNAAEKPDNAYKIEIKAVKKPTKTIPGEVYNSFWQSDHNFPQSPYLRDSYNVVLIYSRVDGKPILKWKDADKQEHQVHFLEVKSQVSTSILLSKNYSPEFEPIAKAVENGEDATIFANLMPGSGVIYSKKNIKATFDYANDK